MDLDRLVLGAELPDGVLIRFRPFSEGDADMIRDVYQHRHYDLLDIRPGEVVFDVGAHIGSFALRAAGMVGEDGLVVAVEPERSNYELLRMNSEGMDSIIPLRMALSDFRGTGRLFLAEGTVAHSLVFRRSTSWDEVPVNTMNGLIEELGIGPDVVKIDAEGAALKILSCADRMRCRKIAIAAYHFPAEDLQVAGRLRSMGFMPNIIHVRASVYRSPFAPSVPIVMGEWRGNV
ncbi:FkbM family methyltransferase [Methanothrix thermoacetophila]|uniref:Methyltransferase FkbM family n=1 Tax=Methanothrix thermoacetophila (strain DSM 6194 / JCM 14653 / NBRC 101360 / PT) TaxID=349307 RepID=A0B6T5_METTP|nr:FkbM family methyltransferase [Methanothrix thermoacetophila]ABK14409.1 methyltransferase FkbM family [Methanothrix thermoacetophila PT]